MGGYGSGQRWDSKSTTNGSKRLDIRYKRKQGLLVPGMSDTLSWSIGSDPCGSMGYTNHKDRLVLNYIYTPYDSDEPVPTTQNIYFETTPCNYGGERKWFICPHCGSRREVLYLYGRHFTCRTCADLNYECQHEQSLERTYRQARKIRQKLKTELLEPDNLSDPVLFKPKGMHQTTFDRLRWKQQQLIDVSEEYLFNFLERLYGLDR